MTNKEAVEVLKEDKKRNEFTIEKGCDMMSAGAMEYVSNLIKAEEKAIEILGKAQK